MPEVFISYSRKDGDFAEVLRSRLKEAGFPSWIDMEGLRAGEEWRQEIDQAIRDSTALIVVLTPASRASAYVAYEWAFALGAGVRVIPILLAATDLPPRLATLQHLDFSEAETRPWKSLLSALQAAADARPVHSVRVSRTAPAVVRDAVAALDSPDGEVMEKAVVRLAEMRLPEADTALVGALEHPVPDVRIAAAWQLAKRRDARAVPGLIEGNRRRGWHHEFARKVAEIGSAAIPAIRAAFGDPQASMRRDLVWSLLEIGDAAVVPDLIRMLEDADEEVRVEAIRALGRLRESAGVPSLVALVADPKPTIQLSAAEALQEIGTDEGLAAVRGMVPRLISHSRRHGLFPPSPKQSRAVAILRQVNSDEARTAVAQWDSWESERKGV